MWTRHRPEGEEEEEEVGRVSFMNGNSWTEKWEEGGGGGGGGSWQEIRKERQIDHVREAHRPGGEEEEET
jgi:hypothetical protein